MNLLILGTRGIPGRHGGFETFAENLAIYLTARGHHVTVYCQADTRPEVVNDTWNGIDRVHFYGKPGPAGTVEFDFAAVRDSLKRPGVILVLGYNTAVLSIFYRLCGRVSLMNMDGIEWKREKWSWLQRLWLRINELAGAILSNHLIADHPEIASHLERYVSREKITMIPYGADAVEPSDQIDATSREFLAGLGLERNKYAIVVARPEPENSLLEIVQGYMASDRSIKLVILGNLYPNENQYHQKIMESAGPAVLFPGAIYDKTRLDTLRQNALFYLHGHRVGGTNPSLVEALAAGNAVIAHDNAFNRWVAGQGAEYFKGPDDLTVLLDTLTGDQERLAAMHQLNIQRHAKNFSQTKILEAYETLLEQYSH